MLYPGYRPMGLQEAPNVLHYGVDFRISQAEPKIEYSFDKHWYRDFKPLSCNPWIKMDKQGRLQEGLFPSPPHPSELRSEGIQLLTDLLVIETVATLNEALCLRHVRSCPPSTELDSTCSKVAAVWWFWPTICHVAQPAMSLCWLSLFTPYHCTNARGVSQGSFSMQLLHRWGTQGM